MAETLTAGRELDALVAEKVMQLPRSAWLAPCLLDRHSNDEGLWCYDCTKSIPERGDEGTEPLRYSTDIAAAWSVMEWLRHDGPNTYSWDEGVAP